MKPFRPSHPISELATWNLLALIVAGGMLLAAGYAVGVTPWNAPDEPAHYNYVRQLATNGQLPELKQGDWDSDLLESLKATKFPSSQPVDSIRYEGWQPPLFYLLAVPIYDLYARQSLPDRVVALRALSVVLSGVTVVLAFMMVRTVFPREPNLQLATAGFIAFLPMRSAIAGSINNDALAELLATLLLLQLLRSVRDGFWRQRAFLLGLTLGAMLLTKMTLYGLVALALPAVLLLSPSRGKGARAGMAGRLTLLVVALGVALLAAGWWFVRNALVYGPPDILAVQRHAEVVVGQPRPERLDVAALSYLGTTVFKSFWGQFGWMGVLVDERLYMLLGLVSGLAALGFLLALVKWVFTELGPRQTASLILLAVAAAIVAGQLLFFNLSFIQAQGRYLYPALVPLALFFVIGLRELMAPVHRRILLTGAIVSLALLNLVCLTQYVVPYFRS